MKTEWGTPVVEWDEALTEAWGLFEYCTFAKQQ
ncbi:hypothetical protein ABID00_002606 [Faecalicatena orotica]